MTKQEIINLVNEGAELHFDSEFSEKNIERDHKIKVQHLGQYDGDNTEINGQELVDGDLVYKII